MEKEFFYHIHRYQNEDIEKEWMIGNTIEFSKPKYNMFVQLSLDFKSVIPEVQDLQGNIVKDIPFLDAYNYYNNCNVIDRVPWLIHYAKDYISEYQILIRELAYEQIRLQSFPDLPSRFHCIWLCKEKQLDFWRKQLYGKYKIFKVEIDKSRSCFKTNNSKLSLPSDSYLTIINKANEYWNYEGLEDNEQDEYLYEGKIKIIEEIK